MDGTFLRRKHRSSRRGLPIPLTPIAGCETRTARIEKDFPCGSPISRVSWDTPRPYWLRPESPFRQPPPHLPVPYQVILPPVIRLPVILRLALPCHRTERCRPIRRHHPTVLILLQPPLPPTHQRHLIVAIHRHLLTASILLLFDQVRPRPAVLIQPTIRGSIGSQGPPLPIQRSHLQPCRLASDNRSLRHPDSTPMLRQCPVTALRPMVQRPIPLAPFQLRAPFQRRPTPIAIHP